MRQQAIELMRLGQFQKALGCFENLLVSDSTDWSVYYMAGQCARFSKEMPKAKSFLQKAISLNNSEPSVYLAYGIALQLSDDLQMSVEAFRSALELDSNLVLAYNSLGLSQKKLGKLDLAKHSLEEGLRALSRNIAVGLVNQRSSPVVAHPSSEAPYWTKVAIGAAMFLSAREPSISKLAWPSGEMAAEEARTRKHGGLFWTDQSGGNESITRLFLPNFFNSVFRILKNDPTYANLLGNLGSVIDLLGDSETAQSHYAEANEFLSSGRAN